MSPLMQVRSFKIEEPSRKGFRKYYFVCEGEHTEYLYFTGISNERSRLGISNSVDIILCKRTKNDQGASHPRCLLRLAKAEKAKLSQLGKEEFDPQIDRFIIVFDADVFKSEEEYLGFLNEAHKENILVAVTNSCFEVWLLLHAENAYKKNIKPYLKQILQNAKARKKQTAFTCKLFSDKFCMNSKKNLRFSELIDYVENAINQEKNLNQDIQKCYGNVSSNIGTIIKLLRANY